MPWTGGRAGLRGVEVRACGAPVVEFMAHGSRDGGRGCSASATARLEWTPQTLVGDEAPLPHPVLLAPLASSKTGSQSAAPERYALACVIRLVAVVHRADQPHSPCDSVVVCHTPIAGSATEAIQVNNPSNTATPGHFVGESRRDSSWVEIKIISSVSRCSILLRPFSTRELPQGRGGLMLRRDWKGY